MLILFIFTRNKTFTLRLLSSSSNRCQLLWQPLTWPYTVYLLHMQWEKDVRLQLQNTNTAKDEEGGAPKVSWKELGERAGIPEVWREFVASIPIPPQNFYSWHKVEQLFQKLRQTYMITICHVRVLFK